MHADFKPSNTFLTDQGIVKVLDFGVARVALGIGPVGKVRCSTQVSSTRCLSRLRQYQEMLVGEAPDPRDDIYALACVTYFLLTGRHPFSGIDAIKAARFPALLPSPIEGIGDHQWRAIRQALLFRRWDRTACQRQGIRDAVLHRQWHSCKPALLAGRRGLHSAAKRPWFLCGSRRRAAGVGGGCLCVKTAVGLSCGAAPAVASIQARSEPAVPIVVGASANMEQLERRLGSLDPMASDFIEKALAAAADAKALASVAPGDDVIRRMQSELQSALAARVERLLARDDQQSARELVAKVASLLPLGATRSYSPRTGMARRQELVHLVAAPRKLPNTGPIR